MYISLTNRPERGDRDRRVRTRNKVSSVVISLGIVSMLTDISSESVSAILPLYITSVLGLSTIAYGILDGLYQGVSAFVRLGGGWLSDRNDMPKWVAFTGYGLSMVARVGLLFAGGFAAITAVLTADRLGKGIRTAPRDALITAASPKAQLATAFGVHRTLDNLGAAVGPLLAFVILLLIPNGFSTVFVVSLAFAIIGVAVLGIIVPNRRPRAEAAEAVTPADTVSDRPPARPALRWRELAQPGIRILLAASGILGLLTIGDGFLYLVLQTRDDFAAQWFPLLYVGTNVAFLALAIPLGRVADRFGRVRVFIIGHVLLLAAYVSAALPFTGAAATVVTIACLGAYYAATDGVLPALATQFVPASSRGTGIAAAQTVVAIARFVSAAGFGVLWFAVGRVEAMVIVSIALGIGIPVVAAILLRLRRHRLPA
ncbi:MFS transporter [Pseudolysinimonas sp.]|uniref:MFS transporter n=1 Tax=Pseudolysinimonas sp. TaxID=2680009 RepID=UPI003F7DD188